MTSPNSLSANQRRGLFDVLGGFSLCCWLPYRSGPTAASAVPIRGNRRWTGVIPLLLALVRARGRRLCSQLCSAPSGGRSRPNDPCGKAVDPISKLAEEVHFIASDWMLLGIPQESEIFAFSAKLAIIGATINGESHADPGRKRCKIRLRTADRPRPRRAGRGDQAWGPVVVLSAEEYERLKALESASAVEIDKSGGKTDNE